MKTLADDLYISQRQLERVFKQHVGVSPKYYARILRIEQARDLLKQAAGQSLSELSQQMGFYDQSHFTHEFKTIVGMTPLAYTLRHARRISED